MTTLVGRAVFSLATRVVKVTAFDCASGSLRRAVCACGATASVGQRTIERARLWRGAAPLPESFDLDHDPSRSLREGHHVAAADGAARLINGSAGLAAQEAHPAFLDDARSKTSRLEKAGAPEPDIDAAGVLRHEAADESLFRLGQADTIVPIRRGSTIQPSNLSASIGIPKF